MAASNRELLLQTEGIQTHRHARRQDRSELRLHDPSGRSRDKLPMNPNRPHSTLSPAEREAIERSVLGLSGIGGEDAKKRLAGTLPPEFVATREMRAYREALAESGSARPNDPIIKMSSSVSVFDTDAYLAAEGVDVDEAASASLRAALKTVEDLPPLTA